MDDCVTRIISNQNSDTGHSRFSFFRIESSIETLEVRHGIRIGSSVETLEVRRCIRIGGSVETLEVRHGICIGSSIDFSQIILDGTSEDTWRSA
jgi:hypothetical protein